ncbi:TonB-dependent receptor domain-containing protein [Mucilaginibacter sp.]|uniref:TonB-dependent receptor domain-containing protein n=1 Tax=Mucilaginibacter sp. TaxID=1882438 RepID=UPI00356354D5
MLKFFLLFFVLMTPAFLLKAQVSIKAKITDANRTGIPFANVSLSESRDSTLIKGTQADSSGVFELRDIRAGRYILRASYVGYIAYSREIVIQADDQRPVQFNGIILLPDPRQLNEVVIEGERKAIRYEPSKMTLQIAGNSTFKSSVNVLDILRKAPGLTVNPDGTLLVSGRNVPVIFINGKPISMSPEESLAYLNGLTPDLIATIEVISNPSSKYDGQYKAIIDIKLKADPLLGWKGSANSAFRRNVYSSSDNNLNLSYRSKKATYMVRGGYVIGDDYYRYIALQQLANTNYMGTYTQTRTFNNNITLQLGADYALSKDQSLELSIKTYQANRDMDAFNTLTFSEPFRKNILDISQTTNLSNPIQRNYAFNAAYNHKFSESTSLNLFGSVTGISNRQNEDIQIRDQLANTLSNYWKTALRNNILIRNIQADYTRNTKNTVLETGGKFAFITTNNDLKYDTLTNTNIFVSDAGRTNKFIYNEFVSAGYVSYGYKYKKLDIKLSVRVEHTHTEANSVTKNEVQKRDYLTWLPGASASYQAGAGQRISLAFTRRMTRPDFDQLNPFRFYLSPLNYRVGNPYLRPSITSSFNLAYSYRDFNINITAGREKDLMTRYPEYNRVTNELLYLGTNLPYSDFAGIEPGYIFSLTKWWKATHNIGIYYNKQQMPYLGNTYAIGVIDYSINGSQVFNLPKGITADLTYRYQSKSGNSLYIAKAVGSVDIGLQKSWWQSRLNTKLNAYDIFYTHAVNRVFREKSIIDNQFSHRFATRRLVLTLGYNFGNSSYKTKQSRANEDEKRAGY